MARAAESEALWDMMWRSLVDRYWSTNLHSIKILNLKSLLCQNFYCTILADLNPTVAWHAILTLNIPSLACQRCLPGWGPRRTPWFFCNFSNIWCGRLLKLCFLGFWNYNSVIQALLASNILCLFISTEVTGGHGTSPHSLITHPASEQCHLLSIIGGPFFKFTTFRT